MSNITGQLTTTGFYNEAWDKSAFSGIRPSGDPVITFFIFLRALESVVGWFSNGLILAAVIRYETLRTATNLFLVSLAVADLLLCSLTPLAVADILVESVSSWAILCQARTFLSGVALQANFLCLVMIAVVRLITIQYALTYQLILTNGRIAIATAVMSSSSPRQPFGFQAIM